MSSQSPVARPASHFYGRRKGHALRQRPARLMDDALPRLRVPQEGSLTDPAELFAGDISDVWLEIGFGGGEHLAYTAARRPEIGLIGCEPFINGVAKLLARIEDERLGNIRLHDGDAVALLKRLPSASIGRVYLLYPDPWPKRRQRKRRFVSEETLAELARVLKPGGEFRFATDIDDYAAWTLARLLKSDSLIWQAVRADDWRKPWPYWPGTRYEAKARREGRASSYLIARRS